jgi:hypothetical protein
LSSDYFLFDRLDDPECAYMIKEGSVIIEFTEEDKVEIKGEKKVVGADSLLLTEADGLTHYREYRAVSTKGSDYKPVEPEKLQELIMQFNSSFSITRDLSELQAKTNKILAVKDKQIGKAEKLTKEYCKIFATAINKIIDVYNKKRFPWLEKLANKYKNSTTYEKGKSFVTLDTETKQNLVSRELDKFNIEYPPGSTICEEGDTGTDMYIIVSGKIQVIAGGNPVAKMDTPGTVIGESALLLGQPRTATMKTLTETVLTVVRKKDIKKVWESKPDFFKNIAVTLSRNIVNNALQISDLNDIIQSSKTKESSEKPQILRNNQHHEELHKLKNDLWELKEKVQLDWIYDLFLELSQNMRSAQRKFSEE